MKQVDSKKKDYEKYEQTKNSYEKDLGEYDKEIDKEKKREGDILTMTFEAKVTIREKPAQPAQPSAYEGATLDLTKGLTDGTKTAVDFSETNKNSIGKSAYLINSVAATADKYKPSTGFASRMGYLLTTLDNT